MVSSRVTSSSGNVTARPSHGWRMAAQWASFLVFALGVLAVGCLYYRHQVAMSRQLTEGQLSVIAALQVQEILEWRKERLSGAEQIMCDPFAGQQVEQFLSNPAVAENRASLSAWLTIICRHNQGLRAVLLDPDMHVQLTYPDNKRYFGPTAQAFASEGFHANRVAMSDLHRSRFTDEVHLDLAIPVRIGRTAPLVDSDNQPPIAMVVVEVDPRQFLYPHIQRWPTPSPTAESLLVRRDGDTIVYLNELRHVTGAALSLQLPISRSELSAAKVLCGSTGAIEGIDYRNVPVLAYGIAVPDTSWFIVAKVDQAEAYSLLHKQGMATAAITLLVLVVAALCMNVLRRRRENEWVLAKLAMEAEYRLILDSTDEGILGLDAAGRHVFVNPAACRMLGYAPEEMIGQHSHGLWHHQQEDGTLFPSDKCPIWRALGSHESYHSDREVFWKKDGTSIPVECVATPAQQEDQRIAMVLIFRDVSEQRLADERYRVLFEQSRDAITTIAPPDWQFTSCNPAALTMFRVQDEAAFTALGPSTLSPPQQPDGQCSVEKARAMIETALRDGSHFFEWLHRRIDGDLFPANVLLTRMELAGRTIVQATIRDITQRREIEAQRDLSLERQKLINVLQRELLDDVSLPEKLWQITDRVVDAFGFGMCGIWIAQSGDVCEADCVHAHATVGRRMCRDRKACLILQSMSGHYPQLDALVRRRMPFERYLSGTVTEHDVAQLLANTPADSGGAEQDWTTHFGLVGRVGYPLCAPGGDVIGLLAVFAHHAITPDEETCLETLARAAAQTVHNARVAEALHTSQDSATRESLKLRSMIEGMAEGVVVADAKDVITDVNCWLLTKIGCRREDIVGKPLWDFHGQTEGTERLRTAIDEFRCARRHDTYVNHRELLGMQLCLRVQPMFDNDEYRGVVLNVIDVTDLVEAREAAMAADRAKTNFLANVSHEIRTPMAAILGFTEVLLDGLTEPGPLEAAQVIRRNGEHLLTLINDILNISKIEAGRIDLQIVPWSPRQVIADVLSLLRVPAAAKGLTLTDALDGPVPEKIMTDPSRLRQILINLVGNAIKFTDRGGVHLVTRLCDDRGDDPQLLVAVSDTGVGIEATDLDRVFEPFTQVDSSASRRHEGTGLGLAISRKLARALGGDLTVRSELGQGSTFTVRVSTGEAFGETPVDATNETESVGRTPCESCTAETCIEDSYTEAAPRPSCCVLLTDDTGTESDSCRGSSDGLHLSR